MKSLDSKSIFKKILFLNSISSFCYQLTAIICGFILPRMILKVFGSEVNGLINSITQFLGFISFLELGVGAVIQSSLYKPLANKDIDEISKIAVSGQSFFTKVATALLIYVVLLIFIYPTLIDNSYGFLYTAIMIIVLCISSLSQYFFGIINRLLLIADQKGYISYFIQSFTLILNTFVSIVLINMGASIHIVKLASSLIFVTRPIILNIYVRKNYKINWKIKYDEEPIKQKWNGIAQHIAAVVLGGTDSVILSIFTGLKAVSVYSVYHLVVTGVTALVSSISNGFHSLIGNLWARQEIDKLRNLFGWMEWLIHTVTVLIFGITSILIIPFIVVYTKNITDINYVEPLFAYLIVAANALICLRDPYIIMILAGGHYKQTQHNYIIAAILNIAISVITVRRWGLVGVAIGTLIAMAYQTVWMAWYNSKNFIYWPFYKFVKQMIVDLISLLVMQVVLNLLFLTNFFSIKSITYLSWIVLAIKVSLICLAITFLVNFLFYKKNVFKLYNMFKSLLNKLRRV